MATATLVEDPDEEPHALEVVSEQVVPGRWAHVRALNPTELRATSVPLATVAGTPVPDPALAAGTPIPDHVTGWDPR